MASLKGHGIAANINRSANPKNIKVRLCFADGVAAFFTDTLPTWTNINAIIIINPCSIVKNLLFASFILLPISFNLLPQPFVKYNANPINNCISQLSINKKLLRLSADV